MSASEQNRLKSLEAKHATLESKIEKEFSRPASDDTKLKELKLQKLKLKEEIEAAKKS